MNPTWLYVGAVYGGAVALALRAGIDLSRRVAVLFYLLVLMFMFRPMTGPYVNFPADFVQTLPPWTYVAHAAHTGNSEVNDLTLQIVPWAHQVRQSWKKFQFPLWNARSGSGYPLLGNGQSAPFSPIRFLALPLPLSYAITAEAAFKLLAALTFMFLYCRRRYGPLPSTIGAVSFGFGSFVVVWLHFPLGTVACFLPATLYALDLLLERVTYGRFAFAVLTWVAILFGGHPETAAHIFLLDALYLAWILGVERPYTFAQARRLVGTLCLILVTAAVIGSPFLATFAEGLRKSKRFTELKTDSSQSEPPATNATAVLLFFPHFFGNPTVDTAYGPEQAEMITGFAGILGAASMIALLLQAVATRTFRTREFFFVLATLLMIGVVLQWPVIAPLFRRILALAANGRLRLLVGFLIAIQSAAVTDMLLRAESSQTPRVFTPAICLLAGSGAIAGALWLLMTTTTFTGMQRVSTTLTILPTVLVLAVTATFVLTVRARPIAAMVLLTAVIAELWSIGIDWNGVVSKANVYPTTPLIRALQTLHALAPRNEPFRIVAIGPTLFPNVNALYGFDDIRVHDPMANDRYIQLLRMASRYDPTRYFAPWVDIDSRLLDLLNVRYLITEPGTEVNDLQRYLLVYSGRDGKIYENRDMLPRFFHPPLVHPEFTPDGYIRRLKVEQNWGSVGVVRWLPVENDTERDDLLKNRPEGGKEASVRIVEAQPTNYRLRVDAPRYSLIVSSIPLWPGWHVTANGRTLEPLQVDGALLGFVVRPGLNDVRVWFSPTSFNVAITFSLLTLFLLAALSRESLRNRLSARWRSAGAN